MQAAIFFVVVGILTGIQPASVCAAATTAPGGLPAAVVQRLNEQYPGWKLAPVSKTVWQLFKSTPTAPVPSRHPCVVRADFDGDQRADWAVQIALINPGEEEQFVTVFLSRDGGLEEAIVESRGMDPGVYLWSDIMELEETASGRTRTIPRPRLIIRGGALGDSAYVWEDGQFRESAAVPDRVPAGEPIEP